MLPREEILRYKKHIMLPEIGMDGQKKIRNARVLVVGSGGLGSPVLSYLTGAGVGTIGIIDFDRVETDNLHRQILFTESDLKKDKVSTAISKLQQHNSGIEFIAHTLKLDPSNATEIFDTYDLIIDGSDNFATRYLSNDTCVSLGKPLVFGSVLNFQGQLAVFNHKGSKNLRDLFPLPPPSEDVPNCDENGVIGTLPGIIGCMMAQEALKLITGLPTLHNEFVLFDTLHLQMRKLHF
ncbi:HesA/MoeB/ThiF family protein [Sphingobacterium spiritivorum]|uniref:HesA/MoeB/ThiF family protein n=1 Tax=Sphingobacterium spiritivorum TaxID=258 RepID=UPI001917D3A6|nr:HesA/MoeB/ThiF family protein [Sphingobacterium spiritivorum]QQT26252.1 HesA/MoeB/ThiF family protein [Sphingobacterium spiritivorum]